MNEQDYRSLAQELATLLADEDNTTECRVSNCGRGALCDHCQEIVAALKKAKAMGLDVPIKD